MSGEEQESPELEHLEKMHSKENDQSEDHLSPDNIQELEEEIIKLAEDSSKDQLDNIEKIESSPIPNEKDLDTEDMGNPFTVTSENEEAGIMKKYQNTLQELKEEISKLNRQIENKTKQKRSDPTEEELFKIQALVRLNKAEAKNLRAKAEEMADANSKLQDDIENLKDESALKNVSNDKVTSLKEKMNELQRQYLDLARPDEINLEDLEKVIDCDANPKVINEFYVNLSKKIDTLEFENSNISSLLKKDSVELAKLKEKLENSTNRHKQNEEMKHKLKALEETYQNYLKTEEKVKETIRVTLEEFSILSATPENQHDVDSARNILKEMRTQAVNEETDVENLEFALQEKKNLLRAAQVYGLQRSKTSNKLRSDMELLGLVLVEKQQAVSRLRKEIDEFRIKTSQVQIDIKEATDKKNNPFN